MGCAARRGNHPGVPRATTTPDGTSGPGATRTTPGHVETATPGEATTPPPAWPRMGLGTGNSVARMTPRPNGGTTLSVTAVERDPRAPACATLLERNGDAVGYIPTCTSEPLRLTGRAPEGVLPRTSPLHRAGDAQGPLLLPIGRADVRMVSPRRGRGLVERPERDVHAWCCMGCALQVERPTSGGRPRSSSCLWRGSTGRRWWSPSSPRR